MSYDEWDGSEKRAGQLKFKLISLVIVLAAMIVLVMLLVKAFRGNSDAEKVTQVSESETTQEAQPQETVVSAAVGAMDDMDDPQASNSSDGESEGSSVDLTIKGRYEAEGTSLGIDVSKYQGTIDWEKVAEAGVEFAIVRTGYRAQSTGVIYEDPCARYNLQEAQKYGILTGAYFFSTAVTEAEAKEEADFTLDLIAKYEITYPVAYNCEGFQNSGSRQYGLSVEERSGIAKAFLDEIQEGGYTAMFYAAKNEMEGNALWDTDTLNSYFKIWLAEYPDTPYPETTVATYGGTHAIWQYTSRGTVDGISKNVDLNVAYFTYLQSEAARDDSGAEEVEANVEVGINFSEVQETVTAKEKTNLRTEPSSASDETIAAVLENGETATRTGIGNNGWSRLEYDGQTLYAISNYLTTDLSYEAPKPVVDDGMKTRFTSCSDSVTAKDVTNLRTLPGAETDETVVAQLHNGEVVTRTGISDNGWARVEYNGQTLYCVNSYLCAAE